MKQKKDKMSRYLYMILIVLWGVAGAKSVPAARADDVRIVAHQSVSENEMSKNQVKGIFLGEKIKWEDGGPVRFVLFFSDVHDAFLKEYIGITSAQYRNYWKKKVFTGQARSPKSFRTHEKMLAYIAKTSGAIGYLPWNIPLDEYKGKVKTITINNR